MEFIGFFAAALILFKLGELMVKLVNEGRADQSLQAWGVNLNPHMEDGRLRPDFSIWRRIFYAVISILRGRPVDKYELYINMHQSEGEMEIVYFVPRRIIYSNIFLTGAPNLVLKDAKFVYENGEIDQAFGIDTKTNDDTSRIRLLTPQLRPITKTVLKFKSLDYDFSYKVETRTVRDKYPDYDIMRAGFDHYTNDNFAIALESLEEYLGYSDKNPHVFGYMAEACHKLKKAPEFEKYILKMMVYGQADFAGDRYRAGVRDTWFSPVESINQLRDRSRDWKLEDHHGLVVLEYDQVYQLGFNEWCLKKVRETFEIRRPVAARMLSRVGFDFSTRQILLFSACRIIKADGAVIDLPMERFVVGDSPTRNIYITTEQEKSGSWILPDLSAGDIVELGYRLLCRESFSVADDRVPLSIVSTIQDPQLPTFIGKTKIMAPKDQRLKCSRKDRQADIEMKESDDEEYQVTSLTIHRYVPVRNTNSYFGSYGSNPVIACATELKDWSEVAQSVLIHNFGKLSGDEDLPAPLFDFVAGSRSAGEALRRAFYWIRDKLKYAAMDSSFRLIGKPGRAEAIIRSGVADCKDKSYLLYLVCKKLDLEAQLVAVSSQYGIVFDDLPSDQFDHVFIRVRLDDRWYYLDAANRHAVFESCPPVYQGTEGLIINDGGRPQTIEVDEPDRNRVSITETFDRVDLDWLSGTFHLEARGNIARLVDENLKAQSLQSLSQLQAAQSILRGFLPSAVLISFDRISHTAHSDTFEALGMQNRCQLSSIGNRLVGTMEWNDPTIPTGYWKNLCFDREFVFYQPTTVEIDVVLSGGLPERISDVSDSFSLSNELCDITGDTLRRDGEIIMRRRIVIRQKVVERHLLPLVPVTMEAIERAFQTALILEAVGREERVIAE